MITRPLLSAGFLAGALLVSSAANAAPGVATGDVNMRTGPGTGYSVITTIPAGAPLEIYGCSSWCQVGYAGTQGYVSGNYVSGARVAAQPYAYAAPVQPYYYDYGPGYDYAYGPSVSFGFGFGGFDGGHRHHHRGWGGGGHHWRR